MAESEAGRPEADHSPYPYAVVHVAVTLDGATTGFQPDVGRFYELAATWREDATLTGADTVLAQERALAAAPPGPGPDPAGPLLAVVDGGGRVRAWEALRTAGHWSRVLALHARGTPERGPRPGVEEYVAGDDRVDLRAAFAELGRRGAGVVRVDSGGALTGALLRAGLLHEVSLLVHPRLSGPDGDRRWYGDAPPPATALRLLSSESLPSGLVWLRYRLDDRAAVPG